MAGMRAALIVVLLGALVITSAGWILAESKPTSPGSLPAGIYEWTEYFRGYQAYLDQAIFGSIVHGTSMFPTFRENDMILWVKVNPSDIKLGDVIVFRHPTTPNVDNVVHRVVEIQLEAGKYSFRTQGDNLSNPDRYYVPEANVHGLVIGVVYQDNHR